MANRLLASLLVHGTPQQQGSKSPQGWETNKKLKPWRLQVAQVAGDQYHEAPYNGPIKVNVTFMYHRRTQDLDKNGRPKIGAPYFKETMPDLDKLQRAIGDALTGVVWTDDAKIVVWSACKVYSIQDGCKIDIYAL